ncbi:MAG: hypothetical protein HZB41_02450 [Ignavibacteriae bacterium]|nr:hypothetical protein [Ignavibacteriota bacterium]
MKLLFRLLFFFFLLLIFINAVTAQIKKKEDTPLLPTEQLRSEVGGFIGFGSNNQSGIFSTDSCDCKFMDGAGFGFTIGGLYESEIVKRMFWGGALALDMKSFWASYMEYEPVKLKSRPDTPVVPVLFRYKADSKIWYLTLMPYIKYVPAKFMFFRLGFGGSFVISSDMKHTKELLSETSRLNTGELVGIKYVDVEGRIYTIDDTDFPKVNSLQLSLEPAIAFNFPIGQKFRLSPLFQYSIPLTKFSEQGTDVKLNSWRLMIELRYDITPDDM